VEQWLGDEDWFERLPNADAIRVRHLLAHTSGIPDYPKTGKFNRAIIWRVIRHGSAKFEPEELIGYTLGRKPRFPPGQGFHYSDTGYLVLGRLIEAATGRSYYEALQERILDPQQLDAIRPADRSVLTGITPGYMSGARNLKKDGRMKFDPSSEWTGGGLITTPTMLVRFFGALAEGSVVSQASFQLMLKGGWRDPERPDEYYGYGIFVWPGYDAFGHSGLWPGYRTVVAHDLAAGFTIAVQTNRDGRIDLQGLIVRIAALLNGQTGQSSF
jgi:D-alanyl-D-alanine carboxypeptidase